MHTIIHVHDYEYLICIQALEKSKLEKTDNIGRIQVTLLDKTTQTESVEVQHKESQTNIIQKLSHACQSNDQAHSIQDSQQEGLPTDKEDKEKLPLDQSLQPGDTNKVGTLQ